MESIFQTTIASTVAIASSHHPVLVLVITETLVPLALCQAEPIALHAIHHPLPCTGAESGVCGVDGIGHGAQFFGEFLHELLTWWLSPATPFWIITAYIYIFIYIYIYLYIFIYIYIHIYIYTYTDI